MNLHLDYISRMIDMKNRVGSMQCHEISSYENVVCMYMLSETATCMYMLCMYEWSMYALESSGMGK